MSVGEKEWKGGEGGGREGGREGGTYRSISNMEHSCGKDNES